MPTDPREGLPSASSAHADNLCSGRHLAQIGLPDDTSDDAAYGIAVDKAMAGYTAGLTMEQEDTVLAAREIEERVLELWKTGEGLIWKKRHIRLWDDHFDHHNSGELDALWIIGNRALISDLKSLYGDIPEAAGNMQLRDYAVLVWLNFGCTEITCYINQPKVTRKPELVLYTLPDLQRAYEEMWVRVARSMDQNSPRIPGPEQCKFCRAKGTPRCPESTAAMTRISQTEVSPATWADLTPEEKQDLGGRAAMAIRIGETILSRIKGDLEAGFQVPGYTLKEGTTRRTVTDPQAAYVALADKLEPAEYAGCCNVKISELETMLRKKHSLPVKEAKALLNERLGELIEAKQNKPSLERVK